MPVLKSKPTLSDLQQYVKEMEKERNFLNQTTIEKCLLLGEETGELFKAVRKYSGLPVDVDSKTDKIADELVDIFIYLCSIANRQKVDLEQAFRVKENKNKEREWK